MQTSLGVVDASVDLWIHMCQFARHMLSNQIVMSAVGHFSVLRGQSDACIFCIRKDQIYLASFVLIRRCFDLFQATGLILGLLPGTGLGTLSLQ